MDLDFNKSLIDKTLLDLFLLRFQLDLSFGETGVSGLIMDIKLGRPSNE